MTSRFDPKKVVSIEDRLVRRAAETTFMKWPLTVRGSIGDMHEGPIVHAYLAGAAFEFTRRAGRVVGDALVSRMKPGAKRFFQSVKQGMGINTCDPDDWRNILITAFSIGVGDADAHLRRLVLRKLPKTSKRKKRS